MLVGINALSIAPYGGDGRFLRNALAAMRRVQPATRFVVFTTQSSATTFEGFDCVQVGQPKWFRRTSDTSNQLEGPIKEAGIDMLFTAIADAPTKGSVPFVLYTLDLRQYEEDYLRRHRGGASMLKRAKAICTQAASIVAPSEFVRKRHLALLDTPLNKVTVAPLGVEEIFAQPQAPIVEKPYFLTVGNTRDFKNIARMLEAFKLLEAECPKHNLVVVGHPCEGEPENWGPRVIRIDSCPANYLASVYQHCDVYIQPSLYEGSGVTVLEAMKAGAPVATSRTGGIEEVAGTIPFFFNAESTASIVAAIRWALEEAPDKRQERLRQGRKIADEYTWDRTAWKILAAFKSI